MSVHDRAGVPGGTALALPPLPSARDFLTSAGFAGAAALLAALMVALVAWLAGRRAAKRHTRDVEQRERHHQETRHDEQHEAAVTRCWQRLVWLVETAGIEPAASEGATLGLGPELALELLRGLLRDAEELGDDTLANAVTVYLNQFTLVLAQQGSLLSDLTGATPAGTDPPPDQHTPETPEQLPAPAPSGAEEPSATTGRVAVGQRRRHR